MAYLKWTLAVFLVLAFIAYWKISSLKFYGKGVFSLKNRILIAVIFPILLVFLIFFGSLVFLIILGALVFTGIVIVLFWLFGRKRFYFRKF